MLSVTYRPPSTLRDAGVGARARVSVSIHGRRGAWHRGWATWHRGWAKGDGGGGCGCELCSAVMAAMDLPHAARMHAGRAAANPNAWPGQDWIEHMREEDDGLFRVLDVVADEVETTVERMRQMVARGGYPGGVFDDPDGRIAATYGRSAGELRRDLARLRDDHVVYRALIAAGRPLPSGDEPRSVAAHSALEDRIIERFCSQISGVIARQNPGMAERVMRLCPPIVSTSPSGAGVGFDGFTMPSLPRIDLPSASRAPSRDPKPAAAPDPISVVTSDPFERFVDPIAGQRDYLRDVPNSAGARVAAMRRRVEERGATVDAGVAPIADASYLALRDIATALYEGYQAVMHRDTDPRAAEAFAKRVGQSVPELAARAPDVLRVLGGDAIRDLSKTMWNAIGPQVMRELRIVADSMRSSASSLGSLGDASAAVPVFGQMVRIIVDAFLAYDRAKSEDWQRQCAEFVENDVVAPFRRTGRLGLPFPWHALRWSPNCRQRTTGSGVERWTRTDAQERLAKALQSNLRRWEAIPDVGLNAETMRWWTLASQLMSTDKVKPVFNALGDDQDGGLSASDEQVMLVAAPVAVANGLDVDDFARALYSRSRGWHDPAAEAMFKPEPYTRVTGYRCVAHCSKLDPIRAEYEPEGYTVGETEPANAMQLQFAVLARDAFALAEEAKAGKVPSLVPRTSLIMASRIAPRRGAASGAGGVVAAIGAVAVIALIAKVIL